MNTAVNPNVIMEEELTNKLVKKNIVLLLMGQLVSLLGSSIYGLAMSLYILQITGSGLSFSLNLAISTLPRVIFGPISGVVADRFDRKKMVVTLDILSGFIMIGLLATAIFGDLKLTNIYIATFLLATCSTFFSTPLTASIPNLVDEKNLTKVNSLSQGVQSISAIAGPFLGGLIFAIVSIELFLLINGVSFIFSGVSESFMEFNSKEKIEGKKEDTASKGNIQKKSFMEDLVEGVKYMVSQKWLITLGSFVVFFNLFTMIGLTVPIPYVIRQIWGFTPRQFGTLNMMFPLGMLAGSLVLAKLPQAKSNYKRMMVCVLTFSIVIFLAGIVISEILFSFTNTVYLAILAVLYIIMAVASIFINVPVTVTMQKLVPNDKLGRVYGALGTLAMTLSPIGAIIAGFLVDRVNPWILPTACGVIMIILTAFMATLKELKEI